MKNVVLDCADMPEIDFTVVQVCVLFRGGVGVVLIGLGRQHVAA